MSTPAHSGGLSADQLAAVQTVSTQLASALDPVELATLIVRELHERFGYELPSVYFLRQDGLLHLAAQHGYAQPIEAFAPGRGVVGRVVRTRASALVLDGRRDPDFVVATEGAVAEVCVPIMAGPELRGIINVESRTPAAFGESDLTLVDLLARMSAVSLRNADLYHAARAELVERQRAEERLQQSEERLRTVVTNAPVVLFALDHQGTFTFSEGKGLEALGLQPGQVVGQSVFSVYASEPTAIAAARRALGGEAFTICTHLRGLDLYFETRWAPVRGADGQLDGTIGVATDVTERERQRLRREALLRVARVLAAEAQPERILALLLDEAVSVVGAEAGDVYAWDAQRQELVQVRSTLPAIPERRRIAAGQGVLGRAAVEQVPVVVEDYAREPGALPEGLGAGIRAGVAIPLLYEGRLLGTLGVASLDSARRFEATDVETLELLGSIAAAALAGLERSRYEGVLLALRTAEHELNNQLAVTAGYAEILAAAPELPERLLGYAREAHKGAQAAAQTLVRLGRLARVEEKGWGPLADTTIDLDRSEGPAPPPPVPLDAPAAQDAPNQR